MINLNNNFLIYGYGISGKSVVKYLDNNKSKYFIYDDFKDLSSIKNSIGKNNFRKKLNSIDYIVISPSIKIDKKHILYKHKKKIIIDLDFLSNEISDQIIIGVTGTEGKSTTCDYLNQTLSQKYNVTTIGNFGNTILNKKNLKKKIYDLDIIIIELSSYQLDKVKYLKLNHAIITNIYSDHMTYHGNQNNYINAKLKIFKLLKDKGNIYVTRKLFSKYSNQINCKNKILNMIKTINKSNLDLSIMINYQNIQIVEKVVSKINNSISLKGFTYKNLPFRTELIKDTKNLKIYNDSKCTNINNAIMKNQFINSNKKILILGGRPKPIANKSIVKDTLVLIFGPFSKDISSNIIFYNSNFVEFYSLFDLLSFIKIINFKFQYNSILFSPGGESFDLYKDYIDRGESFNKLVKYINL